MIAGFRHLPGFLDTASSAAVIGDIRQVLSDAPLFQPVMPRTAKPLSVLMSNCGRLGWVSDKSGYRYQSAHPETGDAWPDMPNSLQRIWRELAAYPAPPEACLINYYAAGSKMGSHRDTDEDEFLAPVVSISLGDDAVFHIGGLQRGDAKTRMTLHSGDVVVLGGAARRAYHGIDKVLPGTSDLLPEGGRFNLTLRRVTVPALRRGQDPS